MSIRRLETAIPGLDRILCGGLFEAGVYIVQGPPGVGKTTLANQWCFGAARRGLHAVYVTMLAESHARMMQHMAEQTFFDAGAVPDLIYYVSGYRSFEDKGLTGVLELIRSEAASHDARLLVLDGLVLSNGAGARSDDLRRFIHALQSLAALMGFTVLLLSSSIGRPNDAETTMVDGVFALDERLDGDAAERTFQVRKFRGCRVERGLHAFCITDDGLRFFPRLEAVTRDVAASGERQPSITSGMPTLDRFLPGGGWEQGGSVLVLGSCGSGKNQLGLGFVAVGDSPGIVLASAEGARIARRVLPAAAAVRVVGAERSETSPDQLAWQLLDTIDATAARRVFIDGLELFATSAAFSARAFAFTGALLQQLRQRGVTTVVGLDPLAFAARGAGWNAGGLGALFDGVFELHFETGEGERRLRPLKLDGLAVDHRPLRLVLGEQGLFVAGSA